MNPQKPHFHSDNYVGRYAPTPSGSLHLGNLRTALAAWLDARHHGGKFLLRFDDLDFERVKPEKIEEHQRDLKLLGIEWDSAGEDDGLLIQSRETERYAMAFKELLAKDCIYPCFCSRREIKEYWQNEQEIDSVLYPGTCSSLSDSNAEIKRGRSHCWRFRAFGDGVGDFVVRRRDGVFGYHLACAADDGGYLGVSCVVRGNDLEESGSFQMMIQKALGLPSPDYIYLPMLTGENGRKLSKSDGDDDLTFFLNQGFECSEIRNYLAWTLGQIGKGSTPSPDELIRSFDIRKIPAEPVQMRMADLSLWRERTC